VAVSLLLVRRIAAPYVARVEEWGGVEVLRSDGTRLIVWALNYKHAPRPGSRRAQRIGGQAAAIRTWVATHSGDARPPGSPPWTTDLRWASWAGMLLGAVVAPFASWGLAAL
jgi:hypothetical protein